MSKNKLVEYFFVGPPKTGTTWIYEVLHTIEDVNVSNQTKELEFFNKNFKKGLRWYHNSFYKTGAITCDISPSYFTSDKALMRIKEYNPSAKIIITIRDPSKRLISHYKHNIRFGIIRKIPFEEAIKTHPSLVENSLYAKYLRNWVQVYGRENVLILPLELLSEDPMEYLTMLGTFLNIRIDIYKSKVKNRVNYASQPRSYFLARSARILRKKINDLGFHGLVRRAKKMGLKKFIYEGGKDVDIAENIIRDLKNLFVSDLNALKEFGIPEKIIKEYLRNKNVK